MKITKEWLENHNACINQIAIFTVEWPNGVRITKARLIRAAKLELDLGWLASSTLETLAWNEYHRIEAPAWTEYLYMKDQAWTKYCLGNTPIAWAKYYHMKNQAWDKYNRAKATAIMVGLRPKGPLKRLTIRVDRLIAYFFEKYQIRKEK